MTRFLIRLCVPNHERVADPAVRGAYGKLGGMAGIVANLLLFVGKLIVALLTGGLAVLADAFNNLSDAASSVVTLIGFKLSAAPADDEHPFGHGRIEYIASLVLGVLILLTGYELGGSSLDKILHPVATQFSWWTVAVLIAAIAVKLWLMAFFRILGKTIASDTLHAASTDSRNAGLCTALVLVSTAVEAIWGVQVDGYIGLLVAGLILWAGISVLRDGISPLLGQAPDPELVQAIRDKVLSYDGIVGVHDLIIHNYGPGRVIISLHAEVPASADILYSHDLVDCIEKDIMEEFHAVTCIHMDPVDTENEEVLRLKVLAETVLGDIDERLSLHDFRVVFGETHTNLIFDIAVPFRYKEETALAGEIQRRLRMVDEKLCVVAQVEHNYS